MDAGMGGGMGGGMMNARAPPPQGRAAGGVAGNGMAPKDLSKGAHGVLHRHAVFQDAQRDEGVQVDPDGFGVDQRDATEGHPAAGLAPDHAADDGFVLSQLAHVALILPADKARILSAAFVFTACLQLDDLLHLRAEEVFVQRQVAEEIALAVFHRDDE